MNPPATECYRFSVNGRVQGVHFRQSTCDQARRLGLQGWVRNLADGRVEGLALGAPAALDQLRQWLLQGPPAARVDALDWQAAEPSPGLQGFELRRD